MASSAPGPEEFLPLAERLAEIARGVIRRHFRTPVQVDVKPDQSPVTIADRDAEAAMRELIARAQPGHGVVGEEHGSDGAEAEHVWVLDPIDGTKRFITGNPLFGTLIALLRDGAPVLGLIDMPILEERWIGLAGRPTRHHDRSGSQETRSRACNDLGRAVLSASSPHMFVGADFKAFERVRRRVAIPLYGGDCFSYGLVASGFQDLVIEADMDPYDYMALVPVVTGAGGVMSDWSGAPLGLESDGRTIAAGDPRAHAAALALLRAGPAAA